MEGELSALLEDSDGVESALKGVVTEVENDQAEALLMSPVAYTGAAGPAPPALSPAMGRLRTPSPSASSMTTIVGGLSGSSSPSPRSSTEPDWGTEEAAPTGPAPATTGKAAGKPHIGASDPEWKHAVPAAPSWDNPWGGMLPAKSAPKTQPSGVDTRSSAGAVEMGPEGPRAAIQVPRPPPPPAAKDQAEGA